MKRTDKKSKIFQKEYLLFKFKFKMLYIIQSFMFIFCSIRNSVLRAEAVSNADLQEPHRSLHWPHIQYQADLQLPRSLRRLLQADPQHWHTLTRVDR